jgi:hypothetical protein
MQSLEPVERRALAPEDAVEVEEEEHDSILAPGRLPASPESRPSLL